MEGAAVAVGPVHHRRDRKPRREQALCGEGCMRAHSRAFAAEVWLEPDGAPRRAARVRRREPLAQGFERASRV
jgi:hypothetical protein